MEKDEIIKGIAAYSKHQERIKQLILKHGGKLSQDEFDKEFGETYDEILPNGDTVRIRKKPIISIWPMEMKSFWLGSMSQGDWAKWLDLTQLMCVVGVLSVKKESGKIVYEIIENGGQHART